MVRCSLRPGFTMAEVVVSLALITTALFGATAASAWAARTMMSADALETALVQGDALMDSLISSPACASGNTRRGLNTIRWEVVAASTGRTIDMRIDYFDGATLRTLRIGSARTIPPLPLLGTTP